MKNFKYIWVVGLAVTLLIIIGPILYFLPDQSQDHDPWAYVPQPLPHTDHTELMEGPYETGSDVTRACLECHEDAARQMMQTTHWTWESEPVMLEGRAEPVTIGKKNSINNFCIGIQSNWPPCTACHTGYGWFDADFDFSAEENVDCLVCHDTSGSYVKSKGGLPAEGVDLVAAAQSVGRPDRGSCGSCHFFGGGGNAVKHGDLDASLYNPPESVDVHMGKYDFVCIDCHQTTDHQIKGRSLSVSVNNENQVFCTDCHSEDLHDDERITAHVQTVACQTCHIPYAAIKDATKTHWDWSTAGLDIEEDPHDYLKIKGSFVYEEDIQPEYYWYNGTANRYILGDKIDPTQPTVLNPPHGSLSDPAAKIWPFKVHRANQIYDSVNNYLLNPTTAGEGGFWHDFDWDQAARLGSEAIGMEYSGSHDFTPTEMLWPISHMTAAKDKALQCDDCHSEEGRLDWQALGYDGDPMFRGGRVQTHPLPQPAAEEVN